MGYETKCLVERMAVRQLVTQPIRLMRKMGLRRKELKEVSEWVWKVQGYV